MSKFQYLMIRKRRHKCYFSSFDRKQSASKSATFQHGTKTNHTQNSQSKIIISKQKPNTNSDLNLKQYRQMFGLRPGCGETTRETSLRRPSDISGYRDLGRIQDHVRRMFTPDQIPGGGKGWKVTRGWVSVCRRPSKAKFSAEWRYSAFCVRLSLYLIRKCWRDRSCAMAEGQSDICWVPIRFLFELSVLLCRVRSMIPVIISKRNGNVLSIGLRSKSASKSLCSLR